MSIASGVIGGLAAALLGAIAIRSQRSAAVTDDGWKRMRPGWYFHLALGLCTAFVVAISIFFALGGSSRPDAREENIAALLLLLAFGAGAMLLTLFVYVREFQWKGNRIKVASPLSAVEYHFSDIVELVGNRGRTEYKLRMASGTTLRVSAYMNGFNDFMEDLGAHFDPLTPKDRGD